MIKWNVVKLGGTFVLFWVYAMHFVPDLGLERQRVNGWWEEGVLPELFHVQLCVVLFPSYHNPSIALLTGYWRSYRSKRGRQGEGFRVFPMLLVL